MAHPHPQTIPMIIKSEPIEHHPLLLPFPLKEEDSKSDVRPPKRRRVGPSRRLEVVLPTRQQLFGDDPPAFEDATTYIEENLGDVIREQERRQQFAIKKEEEKLQLAFLHGKVEVKQEDALSEEVVNRRLALIDFATYDIDLDPEIRDVTTTREFTSKRWGGNTQSTFPAIRKDLVEQHGLDDFMYLNLLYNPHAPQWPGSPGLFFASSVGGQDAHEWPTIERVLVRLKTSKWLYVGQYQCIPAPPLTPDEWKSQSVKVKQTWTTKITTQGWGRNIKAKIGLRKRLGRDPTNEELSEALTADEKFQVTPLEVHEEFDAGRCVLQVWCMKCIGYDQDFQRQLADGNTA